MDITSISARDTATITLKHPGTGELMPGKTVTIYGPGSKQHQAATARRNQRLMDKMAMGQRKGTKLDAGEQAREQADYLCACTHSIDGWDYKGGSTQADILAAYTDASVGWIGEQVAAALGDWATFLPEQATA
jgi:hypothetical protein